MPNGVPNLPMAEAGLKVSDTCDQPAFALINRTPVNGADCALAVDSGLKSGLRATTPSMILSGPAAAAVACSAVIRTWPVQPLFQAQIAAGHVLRLTLAENTQNRWRDILQCPAPPQAGR